jgi:MFS transporter, DHA1 family, multidrug resistance protein
VSHGPGPRAVVLALGLTTFLQWLGASAILPLLPLWVTHHGGSDALAGAVMGAFFVAGLVSQVPAGRLADRIGRRRVLYAGLIVYALGSLAFLLPSGPTSYLAWRFLQGVGVGAAEVAALAIVAAVSPLSERGRAFGTIYAAQLAGLAIGPLFGSIVGIGSMHLLFVVAAVSALAACIPTAWATRGSTERLGDVGVGSPQPSARRSAHGEVAGESPAGRPQGRFPWGRPIIGALAAAAAAGLLIGIYESCWTLLLEERGAQSWQIGLSWTLFAVPFVAMSVPAGRLADRFDRRALVVAGLGSSSCFAISYPFIHNLPVLIGLGGLEAVGVALFYPALQSLLTEFSPPERHGQAQGIFATGQTAATAAAAALGGWMFGFAPWIPFVSAAVTAAAFTVAVPVIWAVVPGRARLDVPHHGGDLIDADLIGTAISPPAPT